MSVFAPTSALPIDDEPYVPSHGIVVVQFGIPHLVYHQGTQLSEWLSEVGDPKETAKDMMGDDHADGVFVWSGTVQSSRDYYGEYDAWLEASDVRPVTQEEWRAFIEEEIVWDFDDMRKYLDWKWAAEKEAAKEEERQMSFRSGFDNTSLEEMIGILSQFSDDYLATPLSKMCIDFNKEPHTKEEQIRFFRDLRDLAVNGGGANNFVMQVFSIILDGLPPESTEEMAARRAALGAL